MAAEYANMLVELLRRSSSEAVHSGRKVRRFDNLAIE